MSKKNLAHAAIVGLVLCAGLGGQALADEHGMKSEKEKCYGVAKAGKDDCATGSSSCAGMIAVIFEVGPGEGKKKPLPRYCC